MYLLLEFGCPFLKRMMPIAREKPMAITSISRSRAMSTMYAINTPPHLDHTVGMQIGIENGNGNGINEMET